MSDSIEGTDVVGGSKKDWAGVIGIWIGGMMMLPWLFMDGEPIVSPQAVPYVEVLAAGGAVVLLVGIVLTILVKERC